MAFIVLGLEGTIMTAPAQIGNSKARFSVVVLVGSVDLVDKVLEGELKEQHQYAELILK